MLQPYLVNALCVKKGWVIQVCLFITVLSNSVGNLKKKTKMEIKSWETERIFTLNIWHDNLMENSVSKNAICVCFYSFRWLWSTWTRTAARAVRLSWTKNSAKETWPSFSAMLETEPRWEVRFRFRKNRFSVSDVIVVSTATSSDDYLCGAVLTVLPAGL